MNFSNYDGLFYKRRLPHAYEQSHPVFITWRLKFCLPQYIIEQLNEQKAKHEHEIEHLSEEYKLLQRYQFSKKQFNYYDEQLTEDKTLPDLLNRDELAEVVKATLHYHDTHKYSLHAYCIMTNHVHAVLTPLCDNIEQKKTLSGITKSLKGFTAREINKLTGSSGSVWARESYDHIVRNEAEFARIISYVANNPVKAGLVKQWQDWKFTWIEESLQDIVT